MRGIKSKKITSVLMTVVIWFSIVLPSRAVTSTINTELMPLYIGADITKIEFTKLGYCYFSFSVTDKESIDYLVWMINKMSVGAERTDKWDWRDGEIYITFLNQNGGREQILVDPVYDFVYTEPLVEQTFCFNEEEFSYFLDIVIAMQSGDYNIDSEINEEPSKWASDYINKVKKKNCIPTLNQIRYSAAVNRLDVCEIIEQFLCSYGCKNEIFDFYRNFYYDISLSDISKQRWEEIYEKEISDDNWAVYPEMKQIKQDNVFDDCDRRSVVVLRALDIIDGKDDANFYPYDTVTREEMAKVLSNLWHYINEDSVIDVQENEFNDSEEISKWAKVYVDEMSTIGVLKGNDNGSFEPKRYMTKEEVIVALLRLFEMKD